MKKIIMTIVSGFILTNGLIAQTVKLDTTDIQKTTQDIKANISNYQKVEKVHTTTDDKYVYLKDKEVKLITIRTMDKGVEKNVAWFYSKGTLVYTEQYWVDPATKKIVGNEKCYLRSGQLIAWVNTENKLVDNYSADFKTLESSLSKFGPKWYDDSSK